MPRHLLMLKDQPMCTPMNTVNSIKKNSLSDVPHRNGSTRNRDMVPQGQHCLLLIYVNVSALISAREQRKHTILIHF